MTDMDEAALRQRLIEEGFTRVFVHTDPPNKVYDEHTHTGDHVQVILEGSIDIITADGRNSYQPADRCDLAAGTPHAAVVGPDGCTYMIGER